MGTAHFQNHALVLLGDQTEVECIRPSEECCTLNPYLSIGAQQGLEPSGVGSWRYPNGSYVRLGLAGDSYGITRQPQKVILHRQGAHMAEGLWRCEVSHNSNGRTSIVGFYSQGRGEWQKGLAMRACIRILDTL